MTDSATDLSGKADELQRLLDRFETSRATDQPVGMPTGDDD